LHLKLNKLLRARSSAREREFIDLGDPDEEQLKAERKSCSTSAAFTLRPSNTPRPLARGCFDRSVAAGQTVRIWEQLEPSENSWSRAARDCYRSSPRLRRVWGSGQS
jgi:hypothetical protein